MLNERATRYFARQNLSYKSLLEAFQETFGVNPGDFAESQFNQQQRIFIVGEKIEEKIERTARWLLKRGVSINCLSYTCYLSDEQEREIFLDLQEVVRSVERQGGTRQPDTSGGPPTESEAIERLPDGLKNIYLELKKRVLNFGQDVQTKATTNNLIFKASKNFAEIHSQSRESCLIFYVRPEGFKIPENQSADVHGFTVKRMPDSHGWALNHQFKVNESSDLDAVTKLLRQSYDGVHRRT
jgi:predicted transport protein